MGEIFPIQGRVLYPSRRPRSYQVRRSTKSPVTLTFLLRNRIFNTMIQECIGSEEALVGKRVRIRNSFVKRELRGRIGTIAAKWGHPLYAALAVILDDGRSI